MALSASDRSRKRRGEPNSPERQKYNAYARQWMYNRPEKIMHRLVLAIREIEREKLHNNCKCNACKCRARRIKQKQNARSINN